MDTKEYQELKDIVRSIDTLHEAIKESRMIPSKVDQLVVSMQLDVIAGRITYLMGDSKLKEASK